MSSHFPYNPRTGRTDMHHGMSELGLMVDETLIMSTFPRLYSNSTIFYTGGYENASLADTLYDTYKSHIIIIEPVENFYLQLIWNKKFLQTDREKASKFEIINKGAGKTNKKLIIHENNVVADGTSFVKQNLNQCVDTGNCIEIDIHDAAMLLKELKLDSKNDVSLLHMNCEGCEFDVLESLISNNLLENFPSIKFDGHYADYLEDSINPELIDRYCRIRYELSKRFVLIGGIPFARERWDLSDIFYFDMKVHLPNNDSDNMLLFKVGVNWNNLSKHLEYDDGIVKQVKTFCENHQLDDHVCFQIWEKTLKMIKIYRGPVI